MATSTTPPDLSAALRALARGDLSVRVTAGGDGAEAELVQTFNEAVTELSGRLGELARVSAAVARGDLSQRVTAPMDGELGELKFLINAMLDRLNGFVADVERIAHDATVAGKLGGQASGADLAGRWRSLTDSVNTVAAVQADQSLQRILKLASA